MLLCKIDFKRATLCPPIVSYVEVLPQSVAYQVGWGEASVYRPRFSHLEVRGYFIKIEDP